MRVQLIKSFSADPEQGSATGVVLEADGIPDARLQAAATELGFPESAFVQRSEIADLRVRYFSPRREVPFCGYATLATMHALAEAARAQLDAAGIAHLVFETGAGLIPVMRRRDGTVVMRQNDPEFRAVESDRARIASLLGLDLSALADGPLQAVSTGTPKLMVPLVSRAVLQAVLPDLYGIEEYDAATGNRGFYPFTAETFDQAHDFLARQFNPTFDRNEDPITGVAAGALAAYAKRHLSPGQDAYTVEQGYFLGKGGVVSVDLRDGVHVGGQAVTYGYSEVS